MCGGNYNNNSSEIWGICFLTLRWKLISLCESWLLITLETLLILSIITLDWELRAIRQYFKSHPIKSKTTLYKNRLSQLCCNRSRIDTETQQLLDSHFVPIDSSASYSSVILAKHTVQNFQKLSSESDVNLPSPFCSDSWCSRRKICRGEERQMVQSDLSKHSSLRTPNQGKHI